MATFAQKVEQAARLGFGEMFPEPEVYGKMPTDQKAALVQQQSELLSRLASALEAIGVTGDVSPNGDNEQLSPNEDNEVGVSAAHDSDGPNYWVGIQLEDLGMVTSEAVVVSYLDTDGNRCYATHFSDETPASTHIGWLEIAKQEVLRQQFGYDPDEFEDEEDGPR
jgi:hypothetical protein